MDQRKELFQTLEKLSQSLSIQVKNLGLIFDSELNMIAKIKNHKKWILPFKEDTI